MKARVLYLEDDETLGFLTSDYLRMHGYEVHLISDGRRALESFQEGKFDICILDVVVPSLDGVSLAGEIRRINSDVPIIFLSARALPEDRILALKTGGDDYLVKPFQVEELILKVDIFLRRSGKVQKSSKEKFVTKVSEFVPSDYRLCVSSEECRLTSRESELLHYLWKNANHILKREDILIAIWGDDDYFMGRSLDVFISRLRKYLKSDSEISIDNVHGVGFKFSLNHSKMTPEE
ncbi:MAG: response regulator transcription factor [Flavobacteriia bacterium]|nr:response regulator transcription factor [Flavobacteriia bacterium]